MTDSKDTPVITQQESGPWGAAQPDLKYAMKKAGGLFNNDIGYKPWTASVQAPLNHYSRYALNETNRLAGQGVQGLKQANNFAQGMIANNGMTADTRHIAGSLGGFSADNGMTSDMRGAERGIKSSMAQSSEYLTPFASGQYQEDPRLAQMLETNANRAINGAATRFGGGRYGSAGIGQGVGMAVADANNGTMLQSNENSRNRELQATGMLSGIQMQGNGLLDGMYQNGQNRALAATNAQGQMYEDGLGRAFQATSALPMLDNLKYSGAERAAGVGDFYQNRSQTEQDARIAAFEANQRRPWEQLGRFNGIVTGMGQLGGIQTGIKPKTGASGAQKAIGGAASGAAMGSMFGPWGTAIGAVGGGLLGGFG